MGLPGIAGSRGWRAPPRRCPSKTCFRSYSEAPWTPSRSIPAPFIPSSARRSSRTAANAAASTRCSRISRSTMRRSTGSRSSCAAPIPIGSTWRRNARGSPRPRSGSRGGSRRTTRCSSTRCRSMTGSTRGAAARERERTLDESSREGPSFRQALRFWLKLGFVSFGGPAGQIAIMHRELVERAHWISERRFLHALNYCMLLPGPEAQQLATYIGWLLHGTRGGIAAGALFVLPSLVILIALSWIYVRFGQVPAVAAILHGVKPAVVAIVLAAAWRIGSRSLHNAVLWVIAAAAFLALFAASMPFPLVILTAAIVGFV